MVKIGYFHKKKLKKLWSFGRTKPGKTHVNQQVNTFDLFNDDTQSITVNNDNNTLIQPTSRNVTKLNLLSPSDADYQTINTKFMSHIPAATVRAIFYLEMPEYIVERHELMKKTIPVPRQTFHGTKHYCDPNRYITSKGEAKPCDNVNCGLCGIIKAGNRIDMSSSGIWSALHATTSLAYTLPTPMRVMFVLDILSDLPDNTLTPYVTQDAAAIPRFLILFQYA
ncbi:11581_t:CDS:2 [Ambispora gerdemannii]|uniref:11581_t:CDS:1 n=1 Tax=Ambispora gerdemannii TaxID=144530 RepID=A0A9N9AZE6_9GLOM|nr:11581_t:CDS:2 [Ambispora gerdemannii]